VAVELSLIRYPEVPAVLQRDTSGLLSGQVWRTFTPLLVDSDGWLQVFFVSVGFLTAGIAVERLLGRGCWTVLFLCGAVVGQAAGYAWQPYGGGTSIALCGLVGGLIARQAQTDIRLPWPALLYAASLPVALATSAGANAAGASTLLVILVTGIIAALVANMLLRAVRTGRPLPRGLVRGLAALAIVSSLALLVLRDNHGAALLAGLAGGYALHHAGQPTPPVDTPEAPAPAAPERAGEKLPDVLD
jgi:membrane associated rhomboid family serine protease